MFFFPMFEVQRYAKKMKCFGISFFFCIFAVEIKIRGAERLRSYPLNLYG